MASASLGAGFIKQRPPISILKPSFSGGEWSPSLHKSVTLEKYASAAKTLKNIIVHPQGGASNRPGFEYIAVAKLFSDGEGGFLNKDARMVPFEFSDDQSYAIETGDLYMRFFTDGGQILKSEAADWLGYTPYALGDFVDYFGTMYYATVAHTSNANFDVDQAAGFWSEQSIYEIPSPYGLAEFPDLQYAQSADVLFMAHGNIKPKMLSRFDDDHWVIEDYPFEGGPFMISNTSVVTLTASHTTGTNRTLTAGVTTTVEEEDAYTVLLLHFDGADAAEAVTVGSGHVNGANAQLDTAFKQFGTASLLLDGTDDYIGLADGDYLNFGTGDFTIDWWMRRSSTSAVENNVIFEHATGTVANPRARFFVGATYFLFFMDNPGNNRILTVNSISFPNINDAWHHVAFVRSGDNWYMFLDGVKVASVNQPGINWPNFTDRFNIGKQVDSTGSTGFYKGHIDEFRVSKGIARWTSDFTLPTAANTTDTAIFDPLHIGSLWRLRHYIEGATYTGALTATGAVSSIKCGGTWRIITHGTWTGKFNVERSIDAGVSWQVIRTFTGADDNNISTFQTDDNDGDPYLIRVNVTAYTSGTINVDLTADPFTQEGWFKVTGFTSPTVVIGDVVRTIGLTTGITDWAEGSWSDYRGWPRTVSFVQDRLNWGGTKTEPLTNWMTETGDYYSFRRHFPLLATDGISVNLPARQRNAIRWLLPLGTLVVGTSSLVWTVRGADEVLTPTSVLQKPTDYSGSADVIPVIIGTRAIYIQAGGKIVRDLAFEFTDDGFVSNNISILAQHLFNNYQIIELAYQPSPDTLMWALRDDGKLLSMTYLREQEVLAWTQHDTDGEFKSICKVQGETFDDLWAVVKRGTDNKRYIEKLSNRMVSTETRDQVFLDSAITYYDPKTITAATKTNPVVLTIQAHGYTTGDLFDVEDVLGMTELNDERYIATVLSADTVSLKDEDGVNVNGVGYTTYISGGVAAKAVSEITGLDHLEGANVGILADGNVIANYSRPKVVMNGAVSLDIPGGYGAYSKVILGRPYQADIETLNIEAPTATGAAQGRKVNIPKVTLQLENTLGGLIGPDFNSLKQIGQSFPKYYDKAGTLFTGEFPENLGGGYRDGGKICIRQEDPLPITVLSLVPDVTVGGKSMLSEMGT